MEALTFRTGAMAHWLTVLAALPKDSGSVPSTYALWLITASNAYLRGI